MGQQSTSDAGPALVKAKMLWFFLFILILAGNNCNAFTSSQAPNGVSKFGPLLKVSNPSIRRGVTKKSTVVLQSTLTSRNNDRNDKSSTNSREACVKLVDPETGCEVVLVGCFHGTVSSAKDVEHLVTEAMTDVVALELCAARFADMNRYLEEQEKHNGTSKKQTPWIQGYLRMVSKTIETRGLATGMASAVLGGVAGLQTALSGFTPGLEFTTALDCAKSQTGRDCNIALVDQDVDETLRRLGSLPQVARGTILNDPLHSIPYYSNVLKQAFWGRELDERLDSKHHHYQNQVQITKVMTRNWGAIQDLARLTIPPLILMQFLSFSLTNALYAIQEATGAGGDFLGSISPEQSSSPLIVLGDSLSLAFTPMDALSFFLVELLPHFVVSALVFSLSYVLLVLPAVSVILAERDEILTSGIQEACRSAVAASRQHQKSNDETTARPGRVVAVLGLLHVNAVAQGILSSSPKDNNSDT